MSHLANIVSRSQQLLNEVLQPGDLAVDLTAGNGSDTLSLAQTVGPTGTVLAFDIQVQALATTTERLEQAACRVFQNSKHQSPVTSRTG